jgi:hypothetical protein
MVINDQFVRTIKGRDHRFIRPQSIVSASHEPPGADFVSPDPLGAGFASPDLKGVGPVSSDPKMGTSVSPDPEGAR